MGRRVRDLGLGRAPSQRVVDGAGRDALAPDAAALVDGQEDRAGTVAPDREPGVHRDGGARLQRHHAVLVGLLTWLPRAWRATTRLDSTDLDRLAAFLVTRHRPHQPQRPHDSSAPIAPATAASRPSRAPSPSEQTHTPHHCRHCGGDRLTVAYGHSYYFRRAGCGGNTPIDERCATCGGRERVRKSGDDFFLDCARCKTSAAFHTNTSRAG